MRLLLRVIARNPGNLLRRLVLPLATQSWSLTSLQQRLFKTGGRLIRQHPVRRPPAGRELLDSDSLSADPRAHRASGVASDLIEGTRHGGRATVFFFAPEISSGVAHLGSRASIEPRS